MSQYIIARISAFIPTLFLLIVFVVVLVRLLPGDAVDIMLEEHVQQDSVGRDAIRERLGLNRSITEEIVHYTLGVAHGDLGESVWSREPVTDLIIGHVPVTVKLAILSITFATTME